MQRETHILCRHLETKRDITKIEEKQRLDIASRAMKIPWKNETAKYTRRESAGERHSGRNVICCPRKTIVRDRPVARDRRERVFVRADLERIPAENGSSDGSTKGFLRDARGRGNNFNHSRRTALMFYEDTYAFLWSVKSQFVWETELSFSVVRSHVRVLCCCFNFTRRLKRPESYMCACICVHVHVLRFSFVSALFESHGNTEVPWAEEIETLASVRFDCVSELKQIMEVRCLFISVYLSLSLSIYVSVSLPVSNDHVQIFIY